MRRQLDDLELCFLSAFTVFVQGLAGHGVAAARSARGAGKDACWASSPRPNRPPWWESVHQREKVLQHASARRVIARGALGIAVDAGRWEAQTRARKWVGIDWRGRQSSDSKWHVIEVSMRNRLGSSVGKMEAYILAFLELL